MADMPRLTIKSIDGYGEVEKGKRLGIKFRDQNNVRALLEIPHQMEGQFLLALQSASGTAAKARGTPADQNLIQALQIRDIRFGAADNGDLGICIELPGGLRLDLVLTARQAREFRDSLEELERNYQQGGSSRTQ